MKKRTWKQLGQDCDTVGREVWTGEQITFKRTVYFFISLIKVIVCKDRTLLDAEANRHKALQERFASLKK